MSARIRFFARPVHGRTHRSALTRGGRCSEPTEIGAGRKPSPAGRDGARPLQGGGVGRCVQDGGVWSPRLTEATQVVPSEGPMYLRHGFRQPNFVPKFRASVMGVGPYAPRGDEGRHAGSSCPTGGCGGLPRLPWVAAHSGAFAARMGGMGRERSRDHPQSAQQPRTIPQSRLRRASSLCTREPYGRRMQIAASLRSSH